MRTFTLTNDSGDRASVTVPAAGGVTLTVDDDDNVTATTTTETESPGPAPVEGSATFPAPEPAPVEGSTDGPQSPAAGPEGTDTAQPAPESATEAPGATQTPPADALAGTGSDELEGDVTEPGHPVEVGEGVDLNDPATAAVVHPGGPAGRFTLEVDGEVRTVEADDLHTALRDEFSDGAQEVTVRRVEAVDQS